MLKWTRLLNSELLEFNSRCLNDKKLKHVNSILMNVDWIVLITGTTSNQKFNQFSDKVDSVLDLVAPIKKVKISTKKRFIEPWMTRSLALASDKKLKLYKKTLSATCTEDEIKAYKSYNGMWWNSDRIWETEWYICCLFVDFHDYLTVIVYHFPRTLLCLHDANAVSGCEILP